MTFAQSPFSTDLRAPDWRVRRAVELLRDDRPASRMLDDRLTRQLHAFMRSRRFCRTESGLAVLQQQTPVIAAAVALSEGDQALAATIQAYLLTGASGSEIGERLGISAATIDAYHDGYFDVRDRLTRRPVIIENVILANGSDSAAPLVINQAIRLIGFLQGPDALDRVFGSRAPNSGNWDKWRAELLEIGDVLCEALEHVALRRQAAATDHAMRESLKQSVRRRVGAPRPEPLNAYQEQMQALLSSLTFRMRTKNPQDYHPAVWPFQGSCVELRPDEEQLLAQGGTLTNAEELLAQKFPPPPSRPDESNGGNPGHV